MQDTPTEHNQDQEMQRFFGFMGKIIQVFHTTQDFNNSYKILAPHAAEGIASVFPDIKEAEREYFFLIFVRSAWDQMPLLSKNFNTSPLPKLQRNDICFCGSELKYKQCCLERADKPIPLDTNMVWSLLLDVMDEEENAIAFKANAVPAPVILRRAQMHHANGHQEQAIKLLEPIYHAKINKSNPELDQGVTILCNAYDDLSQSDKKTAFLERLKNSGIKSLECEAWQRLATIYLDEGRSDRGWDALEKARALGPKNPDVDILEISMLMGDRKLEKAQARAQFILGKWKKAGHEYNPMIIEFMQGVAKDPESQLPNFIKD